MHIQQFFSGIQSSRADRAKTHKLAAAVGVPGIGDARLTEINSLFLAHKAFDDYMATLLGPAMVNCDYVNYPLSALINFAVHQLTMRRFEHSGSNKVVQIGCFTGEEFLCGIMRNVKLDCHLIIDQTPARMRLAFPEPQSWEKAAEVMTMTVDAYLRTIKPRIGALVLANLATPAAYRATLQQTWAHLDRFADIIVAGDSRALLELRSILLSDGIYCSDVLVREQCHGDFNDDGILLMAREAIDYSRILEHDER